MGQQTNSYLFANSSVTINWKVFRSKIIISTGQTLQCYIPQCKLILISIFFCFIFKNLYPSHLIFSCTWDALYNLHHISWQIRVVQTWLTVWHPCLGRTISVHSKYCADTINNMKVLEVILMLHSLLLDCRTKTIVRLVNYFSKFFKTITFENNYTKLNCV